MIHAIPASHNFSPESQAIPWPRMNAVSTCSCRMSPLTATTFLEKYGFRGREGGWGGDYNKVITTVHSDLSYMNKVRWQKGKYTVKVCTVIWIWCWTILPCFELIICSFSCRFEWSKFVFIFDIIALHLLLFERLSPCACLPRWVRVWQGPVLFCLQMLRSRGKVCSGGTDQKQPAVPTCPDTDATSSHSTCFYFCLSLSLSFCFTVTL